MLSAWRKCVILNNRTLVKVSAGENCIGFKTISRRRKSGQTYLVARSELAHLKDNMEVVTNDIRSFATLRRNAAAGTLTIDFSWLHSKCGDELIGWNEMVTLPYDALMSFVEVSPQECGPKSWKVLSLQTAVTPRIVFVDTEGLRRCLENRTVRGKLARALRDNFQGAERVEFYHDFEAYSFMFRSYRAGRLSITGALILHNYQGNLKTATYSAHT